MRLSLPDGQVSVRRMIAINAITTAVVASLALGAVGVGAATLSAFRPAGTIRLATATNSGGPSAGNGSGPVLLLKVDFTVPSGQKADIVGLYTASVSNNSAGQVVGLCQGQFKLDNNGGGSPLPGGGVMLTKGVAAGSGFYSEVRTIQTVKNSIGSGTHTLYVVGTGGGTGCSFYGGVLSVIANLHS